MFLVFSFSYRFIVVNLVVKKWLNFYGILCQIYSLREDSRLVRLQLDIFTRVVRRFYIFLGGCSRGFLLYFLEIDISNLEYGRKILLRISDSSRECRENNLSGRIIILRGIFLECALFQSREVGFQFFGCLRFSIGFYSIIVLRL